MRKFGFGFFGIVLFLLLAEIGIFWHYVQQVRNTGHTESRIYQASLAF